MDVKGMVMAAALAAGAVGAQPIVAVCAVGMQSGAFDCYDTAFWAQEYLDCTDRPELPIGSGDRGGGLIAWGNTVGGVFQPEGAAVYEWAGVQAQAGGVAFAVLGVDEDRIFGDGADRVCTAGRFWR